MLVSLPKDDDPARELYIAFREWKYPSLQASDFNVTEWKSVYFILYQMVNKGISGETLKNACQNLTNKWGNADMVTINGSGWSAVEDFLPPDAPKRENSGHGAGDQSD